MGVYRIAVTVLKSAYFYGQSILKFVVKCVLSFFGDIGIFMFAYNGDL